MLAHCCLILSSVGWAAAAAISHYWEAWEVPANAQSTALIQDIEQDKITPAKSGRTPPLNALVIAMYNDYGSYSGGTKKQLRECLKIDSKGFFKLFANDDYFMSNIPGAGVINNIWGVKQTGQVYFVQKNGHTDKLPPQFKPGGAPEAIALPSLIWTAENKAQVFDPWFNAHMHSGPVAHLLQMTWVGQRTQIKTEPQAKLPPKEEAPVIIRPKTP